MTADGQRAVLLNVGSQPDGSTVAIADNIEKEVEQLRKQLPPDVRVAVFYEPSLLVRESVGGVWESILFGLFLSVVILFGFLKSGQRWTTTATTTLVAVVVIPVTVLAALVAMKLLGMSFSLVTRGGIAVIGLVIDAAIIVIESVSSHVAAGRPPLEAVRQSAVGVILATGHDGGVAVPLPRSGFPARRESATPAWASGYRVLYPERSQVGRTVRRWATAQATP